MTIYLQSQIHNRQSRDLFDVIRSLKKRDCTQEQAQEILETPLTKTKEFVAFQTNWGIGIVDSKRDLIGREFFLVSREQMTQLSAIPNQIDEKDKKYLGLGSNSPWLAAHKL